MELWQQAVELHAATGGALVVRNTTVLHEQRSSGGHGNICESRVVVTSPHSSADLGVADRRGVGKVCRKHTQELWLQ